MSTEDKECVSFSNDVDVEEAAPVEEGVTLSQSEKAWDLNGDGRLGNTEKALKDMDKSGKGTLSKEQMYDLMHQNLAMQNDLKKIKKFVIVLGVFTVLLALANVGVSFAAAYLAKDTKTEEGKLVVTSTGETVKTDSMTTTIVVESETGDSERRLSGDCPCGYHCGYSAPGNCPAASSGCTGGSSFSIEYRQDGGDDVFYKMQACPVPFGHQMKVTNDGLTIYDDSGRTTLYLKETEARGKPECYVAYLTIWCDEEPIAFET